MLCVIYRAPTYLVDVQCMHYHTNLQLHTHLHQTHSGSLLSSSDAVQLGYSSAGWSYQHLRTVKNDIL